MLTFGLQYFDGSDDDSRIPHKFSKLFQSNCLHNFFTMFAYQLNCWDSDNTEYHPSTDAKHGSSHNLQPIDEIFGN